MKSIDLMAALLLHVLLAKAETGVGDGHVGGEAQKMQRELQSVLACTTCTTSPRPSRQRYWHLPALARR